MSMIKRTTRGVLALSGIAVALGLAAVAAKPAPTMPHPTSSVTSLQSVHMYSSQQGLGITWNQAIDQTTDGGARWTNVTPTGYQATGVAAFVLHQGSLVAWIVGNNPNHQPILLMTPNGGYSFHTRPLPKGIEASEVRGMTFTNVNRGWLIAVVNNKTEIFKTVNNGFRWTSAMTG